MARTLPSSVATDLGGAAPLPIWCIEIDTGGSPSVLRFTSREHAVQFGANSFGATPVEVGEIRLEAGAGGNLTLSIADADQAISPTLSLSGREVRLRFTVEAATGAGSDEDDSLLDALLVASVERRQGLLLLHLKRRLSISGGSLPGGIITRGEFPGIPPSGSVI